MKKLILIGSLVVMASGCAGIRPSNRYEIDSHRGTNGEAPSARLAKRALQMLDPSDSKFDPEKGKNYLEYSLKQGNVKSIEVSAAVLLEILKSEKVASEKTHSLEQQLEIMKAIDLNPERDTDVRGKN